jgi:hypothetical protein
MQLLIHIFYEFAKQIAATLLLLLFQESARGLKRRDNLKMLQPSIFIAMALLRAHYDAN